MSVYSKAYQDCAKKLNDKIHALELDNLHLRQKIAEQDEEIVRLKKVEAEYAKYKLMCSGEPVKDTVESLASLANLATMITGGRKY